MREYGVLSTGYRVRLLAILGVFLIMFTFRIYSQEDEVDLVSLEPGTTARSGKSEDMEGNISLDLRDIDIVEALKFLSMKAGVNVVTTRQVAGRVTLKVEDVLIKDVFDVMLRSNNLAFEKRANIYNVMTEKEYIDLYGKSFSDVREVKVIQLTYAVPEQIFNLCDTLKSDIGRVLVNADSGTVLLMDSPEKIEQVEKAIKKFEKKNIIEIFDINYGDSKDIAEKLRSQLDTKNVGSIKADPRTNQVIVQTLPERMKQIEQIIKSLDRKTREVLIDTKILKVKLTDDLSSDIEWEGLFDVARKYGLTYLGSYPFSSVQAEGDVWRSRLDTLEGRYTDITEKTTVSGNTTTYEISQTYIPGVGYVGSYPSTGTTTNYSGGKTSIGAEEMHLGIVGKHDFDVMLKILRDIGDTQILSTPKITVTNNQEARIHVGEKQAYITTTTTTAQTTATVSEEVTFVDVGTQLMVTPVINEEGYVTLKVKTEVSSVIDVLVTPSNNKIPIIDTSVAETTVMAKSGTTIVIGGLRKDEKGRTERKTPILGDIPFLGKLFTSKAASSGRTELLIMITPTIITGDVLVGNAGEPIEERPVKPLKDYYREEPKEEKKEARQTTTKFKPFKP